MNVPDVERFWFSSDAEWTLGDGGFLSDPTAKYGEMFARGTLTLDQVRQDRTVFLIGEPGIGKSTIAKRVSLAGDRDTVALFDLKSYASDESLARALRSHRAVQNWLKGTAELELFLDSLDECPIPSRNAVIARILRELGEERDSHEASIQQEGSLEAYPEIAATATQGAIDSELESVNEQLSPPPGGTGLRLRILCRSGSYLPSLGSEILAALDEAATKPSVFKLAPLRRSDVIAFVTANGGDPDQFMKQLQQSGSSILAAIPLTLQLLFRIFRQGGALPSSPTEIYTLGVRALCEEPNEQRGRADATSILHAAEELAFLCVGSGRTEVGTGRETEANDETQVWYGDPAKHVNEQGDVPGLELLHTATCTGLFTSAGPRSVRWSHWSFAEFLAAAYLKRKLLSLAQLRDIFVHPPTGHVFTPLEETAAWLASMHPSFLAWLVQYDPQCVLRTDVSFTDAEVKEAIVDALLKGFESKTLRDDHRDHYRQLNHRGLAAQLKPWIHDRSKDLVVRRVAIDIAERCELAEMVPDMLALALDSQEEYYTRKQAGHFLIRVGDQAARAQLKPLALGEAGDDFDDDLRGIGLTACWPDSMTLGEVLNSLKSEARSHYFGSYAGFLTYDFKQHVKEQEVPLLLKWVLDTWDQRTLGWHADKLRGFAVLKGVSDMDVPGVLEPLAEIVLRGLKEHRDVFEWDEDLLTKDGFEADAAARRKLVTEIVRRSADEVNPIDPYHLHDLCLSEDYPWALDMAATSSKPSEGRLWAGLATSLVYWPDQATFELIWTTAQRSELIAKTYDHVLSPVPFNSETADAGRRRLRQEREWSNRRGARKKKWVAKQIHELLKKAESDLDCFWRLSAALVNEESGHYSPTNLVEHDVSKLPGWQFLSETERSAWIGLSKRYVIGRKAKDDGWEANTIYHPDVAGYRAIRCILESDEAFVLSQDKSFFAKWAPAVAMMAEQIFGDEAGLDKRIFDLFFERSPDEMLPFVRPIVDRECSKFDHPILIEKLERVWNPALEEVFCSKLECGICRVEYEANLLAKMLALGSSFAVTYAEARVQELESEDEEVRLRATGAAGALISSASDGDWAFLFPILTKHSKFCSNVLLKTIHGSREPNVPYLVQRMGAIRSIELYRLICKVVPYPDDPDWEGGFVDQVQGLRMYRDELIRHLVGLGTEESHSALKELAAEKPPLRDMSWWLLESEANLRRNAWVPQTPASLRTLVARPEGRIVDSDQQLFELVLEELAIVNEKLRDEIRLLWNIPGSGERRFGPHPKEENEFSDYVKARLDERIRERGVVLNREVKIRKGEQTDILIEAVARGPRGEVDTVSVTIEGKCSWNGGLETAMKDQLLDRYLGSSRRNFGILLVGWFESVHWDDDTNKRRQNRDRSKVEPFLANQAAELSDGHKSIAYFGLDCILP